MAWSYIVLSDGTFEIPIVFPDKLVHADVAKAIIALLPINKKEPVKWKPVSAGSISALHTTGLGGGSETLKLKSRKEDRALILSYPYLHGIVGASMPLTAWAAMLGDGDALWGKD